MSSSRVTGVFPLDHDYMTADWGISNSVYDMDVGQWPSAPLTHQQLMNNNTEQSIPAELSQSPWSVVRLPPNQQVDAGVVTFAPQRGRPYEILRLREEILESRPALPVVFGPEPPVSPVIDDDMDGWEDLYGASSYAGSSTVHDSPRSEGLSWCQIDSSPLNSPSPGQVAGQSHMFKAVVPGSASPKSRGIRTRALTPQEKQETRDVRKAKACWACHLSKIKVGRGGLNLWNVG
jgi:hypothetical protein